ncbi:uncharacterized protein BP5553_09033 [Venustampulla echinocandica]|uniref:Uncharacterized protein n=1 Tax=Venustampulla echinocandica TaxID=2656787 RepID=A0A370TDQ6_9HELO|nr:uncharacterized protein BP5553_09033 [Venustampulla echinocandica]RDL32577.1 hypothetical protein BP5553_09033 [Venustampulla echinocandica]
MGNVPNGHQTKPPTSHRLTVSHVITQWKPGRFSRESAPSMKGKYKAEKSSDYLNRTNSPPKDVESLSRIIIQKPPKSKKWDIGSLRRLKTPSAEVLSSSKPIHPVVEAAVGERAEAPKQRATCEDAGLLSGVNSQGTPKIKSGSTSVRYSEKPFFEVLTPPRSAVDTVFEIADGQPPQSPNSTFSSLVAELEDTSPVPMLSKRSAFAGSQLEFQSSTITSRSAIKLIDQTIAAIEGDNRKLLSRAILAEQTVNALREHNAMLQQKVDHCNKRHRRPRASASQPTLRQSRHMTRSDTPNTPPTAPDQATNPSLAPKSNLPSAVPPAPSPPPLSPSHHIHSKPLPSPPRASRPSTGGPSTKPKSIRASPSKSRLTYIPKSSSPKHSIMSPTEARSSVKLFSPPLPVGPTVQGNIEIGLGIDDQEPRELEGEVIGGDHEFISRLSKVVEMEQKTWI